MIIVSITGPTMREALEQIRSSRASADLFEIRLDLIRKPGIRQLIRESGKCIVTCRPAREGGAFRGSEQHRLMRLLQACEEGAHYIDIEIDTIKSNPQFFNELCTITKVIASHHLRSGGNLDVEGEFRKLNVSGVHILKLAYPASDSADCRYAIEFLALARRKKRKAIAIAMGAFGEPTRLLYRKFGGWGTYASPGIGQEAAAGQIPAAEMREVYRAHTLNVRSKVFGLLGNPVGQSKGGYIHNQQFARARMNAVYCPFLTRNLRAFMRHMMPFVDGVSVTLPFKEEIGKFLSWRDKNAIAIGAVNTVVRTGSKLKGWNTDAPAALDAIEAVLRVKGREMLVLGAGGAARAVVFEAIKRGAHVTIANRTDIRARNLARAFGARCVPWKELLRFQYLDQDVVVNTTPVGMVPQTGILPMRVPLRRGAVLLDAVYNPPVTAFMNRARTCGAHVVSGLTWYINQAVAQEKLFGITKPSRRDMEKMLIQHLGNS